MGSQSWDNFSFVFAFAQTHRHPYCSDSLCSSLWPNAPKGVSTPGLKVWGAYDRRQGRHDKSSSRFNQNSSFWTMVRFVWEGNFSTAYLSDGSSHPVCISYDCSLWEDGRPPPKKFQKFIWGWSCITPKRKLNVYILTWLFWEGVTLYLSS